MRTAFRNVTARSRAAYIRSGSPYVRGCRREYLPANICDYREVEGHYLTPFRYHFPVFTSTLGPTPLESNCKGHPFDGPLWVHPSDVNNRSIHCTVTAERADSGDRPHGSGLHQTRLVPIMSETICVAHRAAFTIDCYWVTPRRLTRVFGMLLVGYVQWSNSAWSSLRSLMLCSDGPHSVWQYAVHAAYSRSSLQDDAVAG